jgi:hypothetical protein
MARQKVNVHKGKKSTITVTDANITSETDVRDSPFEDATDATIKLDAVAKSATAGSITIELTGRGPHSALIITDGGGGTLLVTLTDPGTGAPGTGNLDPIQLPVTYVNDAAFKKHHKHKKGESKSGKKNTTAKAKKPALKKR